MLALSKAYTGTLLSTAYIRIRSWPYTKHAHGSVLFPHPWLAQGSVVDPAHGLQRDTCWLYPSLNISRRLRTDSGEMVKTSDLRFQKSSKRLSETVKIEQQLQQNKGCLSRPMKIRPGALNHLKFRILRKIRKHRTHEHLENI